MVARQPENRTSGGRGRAWRPPIFLIPTGLQLPRSFGTKHAYESGLDAIRFRRKACGGWKARLAGRQRNHAPREETVSANHRANPTYCEVAGTLLLIDALARELILSVDGAEIRFDVPMDCQIQLNGERVKLRLLQPLDHAQISFEDCNGVQRARSIRVNWFWFTNEEAGRH